MGNEKNLELSEKLKKAYIGGHSNLKFDLSVTPMKIFVDRMEGARVWYVRSSTPMKIWLHWI